MHRIRNLLILIAMTVAILACGLAGAPSVSGGDVATIVASTMQALTPLAPEATATAPATQAQGVPVSYQNVSLILPMGLAADAAPLSMPATTEDNGGPWGVGPAHVEFRLDKYNVPAKTFGVSQIDIYPAQEYSNQNAGANISLQRLKGILGNPSATLNNETLPQVPSFNAASMFASQIQRIQFANGSGVRTLTQYGQAVGPVTNNGMFYHFQGLTSDGKYYIIAVLPVQAGFLESGDNPPASLPAGGIPFPGYQNVGDAKVYDAYYAAVADKLNATPADQFTPSLTVLDALVQSFKVGP